MSVYMYAYTFMYARVWVYICTRVGAFCFIFTVQSLYYMRMYHRCFSTLACVCVYMCMCVCVRTCVRVCIFVHRLWVLVAVLQRVDGVMHAHVFLCAYACVYIRVYVYIQVHFFCRECYMHFTGVVGTSAWARVYVTHVCFNTNVHICDTLAAGGAHMCICIYVCICMYIHMDAYVRL